MAPNEPNYNDIFYDKDEKQDDVLIKVIYLKNRQVFMCYRHCFFFFLLNRKIHEKHTPSPSEANTFYINLDILALCESTFDFGVKHYFFNLGTQRTSSSNSANSKNSSGSSHPSTPKDDTDIVFLNTKVLSSMFKLTYNIIFIHSKIR